MKNNENIYTSKYIQELENNYCTSRSAIVSQAGLSCGSASLATRIINGGKRALYTAAMTGMLVNNIVPYAYADLIVNADQTSTGLTVGSDPSNDVINTLSNYGTTISTAVNPGGYEIIYDGGVANSTTINSQGYQYISSGGTANNTIINSSGFQFVFSDGIANNTIVNSDGFQLVYDGAVAANTIINSDGQQCINANAQASNTVINSGGSQTISSGGYAFSTTVSSAGNQYVLSGGSADFTSVLSGGTQNVSNGGIANNTVINRGGIQNISNEDAAALWTTVNISGVQNVNSGAIANVTILSGGLQYVSEGGIAINTSGSFAMEQITPYAYSSVVGKQFILSGASASQTILTDFSQQHVSSGGSVANTTITSAVQSVFAGGQATSTTINNSGSQIVMGTAKDTTINSGGLQQISAGGFASNTSVNQNGSQNVLGEAISTIVSGSQYIGDGGIATSTYVNGVQRIAEGGITYSTNIGMNGTQNVYGSALDTQINSGTQIIRFDGIATNVNIFSGGVQNVSGGQAIHTVIYSGTQNIDILGTASSTIIYNGNSQTVRGIANETKIYGNAQQYISNGGRAINTTFYSNGTQNILNEGSASNTIISAGIQNVSGTAENTTIHSGTQRIFNGGLASNTILNSNATQNISNGGQATNTTVSGGTQNISNGGSANYTSVYNGGTQNISNGGVATNTTILNGTQNILSGGTVNTVVNQGNINLSSGGNANSVTNNGIVNLASGGNLSNYSGNGSLNIYGNNTLNGNINLATGRLVFANNTSTTLNVEHLSANNAVISMGVNLENQTADKLVVQSSYNGNAKLALRNTASVANKTSEQGIKLIDISNTATVNGTFELLGGKWDEGGYVYKLFQDSGDPDYYLRSTTEYSDTFKTMANVPMLNVAMVKAGMNSLNKRLGDLRDMNNSAKKQGVWARTYYKDMTVDDLTKTDMSLFGVEAGYDWLFNADEPTKLYAGVMLGYMNANSIKTKNSDGDNNDGNGEAPSVGIYATLANENGWFIDLAARNFWSKIENTTKTASDTLLKFDTKRDLITASLEVGKTFKTDNGFKVEPKVEFSYMNASADSAEVVNGTGKIEYDAANYINGKAAIMFAYKKEMANKMLIEPLLELAYNNEFAGKDKVRYGGAETETSLKGGSFEVNAGLSMQLADNLYWHALGTYEKGSKLSGWGINAGIRLGFGGNNSASNKSYKNKNKYQSNLKSKQHKTYR